MYYLIFYYHIVFIQASLVAQTVKNQPAMQETWAQPLSWEDPLEKGMATTPVFSPGKSHGQRSLVGYSPWRRIELDVCLWYLLFY